MAKIRCGYCGREYDEMCCTTLENGSPACPDCVAYEEAEETHKNERKDKKESDKNEE